MINIEISRRQYRYLSILNRFQKYRFWETAPLYPDFEIKSKISKMCIDVSEDKLIHTPLLKFEFQNSREVD